MRSLNVFRVPGKGEDPDNEQTGWCGGFDVVLGNPPWEKITVKEQEWFAGRCPEVSEASNSTQRRKVLGDLQRDDPATWREFCEVRRQADGTKSLLRNTGRFPLCGRGDTNTYAVFAESDTQMMP